MSAPVLLSRQGASKRIAAAIASVAASYEPGAIPWAREHSHGAFRRWRQIGDAIDALVGQSPTAAQIDAALSTWVRITADMTAAYRRAQTREVA